MTEHHFGIVRLAHMHIIGHTHALLLARRVYVVPRYLAAKSTPHQSLSTRPPRRPRRPKTTFHARLYPPLPPSSPLATSSAEMDDGNGRQSPQRRGRLSEWNDGLRVERIRQSVRERGRWKNDTIEVGRQGVLRLRGQLLLVSILATPPSSSHFAWGVKPTRAYWESKHSPGPFAPYFALLAGASLPPSLSRKYILLTN